MRDTSIISPARGQEIIPWAKPCFWGNEQRYVAEALASTWISGGAFVDRLEREFCQLSGAGHALTSSNGTTALHMAYLGVGLKAGDEVIVPAFGFLAAANLALNLSLRPVFCDVDAATWCMRAEHIEKVITPKTKAIVVVHSYGGVCDMDPILALASRHGIFVIEDAAEAFPCFYKGRMAGTLGHVGTYSFQATKTMTTGEGGMVVTSDDGLRDRMALYRSHGLRRLKHYWHEVPGLNFRLTNMQAALGCAQFEALPAIVAEKERVDRTYRRILSQYPGVILQDLEPGVQALIWAVAVRLDSAVFSIGRDAVVDHMTACGVECRPGFYPPSALDYYEDQPPTPVSEMIAASVISLPSYPTLSDAEIATICEHLIAATR